MRQMCSFLCCEIPGDFGVENDSELFNCGGPYNVVIGNDV